MTIAHHQVSDCTTEFIKQHGCSGHDLCQDEVGVAGVTLAQIQNHLLENITALKVIVISKHTIARSMEPPRKYTIPASRYQGYVKARVPEYIYRQYREHHTTSLLVFHTEGNLHKCFQNFVLSIFSCDDMNKIKIEALAFSRYHQIEHFFPITDAPNVPDHDFLFQATYLYTLGI